MSYGHWSVLKEADIRDYLGFVYVITFDDGRKYIGAKKIWKRIKTAPSTFKRGPKAGFEESDWKSYTSSSSEVNKLINENINPKEYLIVGWYSTWGKTLMAEMEMQLANDVLRDSMWLNKQIGGQFNPNCYDDLTSDDISKYINFEKGNEHVNWQTMYKIGHKTKYVKPEDVCDYIDNGWQIGRSKSEKQSAIHICHEYKLWDYQENKPVFVKHQANFARENNITAGHLSRVLSGELDLAGGRYGLPPDIARRQFKYRVIENDKLFSMDKDVEEYFGVGRGMIRRLLKDKKVERLDVETRQDFKARVSTYNLVEKIKIENTSILMENSFKDVTNNMSSAERFELIGWLKQYIEYLENEAIQ